MLGACLDEGLIDARVHLVGAHAHVLQPERDLALDGVVDGLELRVLEDKPDRTREKARGRGDDVEAGDLGRARDAAAMKVRHEAVQHAQQGGLAAARWSSDKGHPLADDKADVMQRRHRGAWIPICEVGQTRRRQTNTGANKRRQETSAGRSIRGATSEG